MYNHDKSWLDGNLRVMNFLYYPLVLRQGNASDHFPGAQLIGSVRGAHRHRVKDLLAVLLSLSGEHRYSADEISELAAAAADVFFGAQGSVTRALQAACDQVNKLVLDRNLDRGYEGIRTVGSINLAALHNDWLFVAQYGSTETIHISNEQFDEYGGSEGQSETLGQSKRIQPRFYQCGIKPGDLILMNDKPPESWSSYYLAGSAELSMTQVKERLLNQVTADIEAIVIKCAEGSGQIIRHSWDEEKKDLAEITEKAPFSSEIASPEQEIFSPEISRENGQTQDNDTEFSHQYPQQAENELQAQPDVEIDSSDGDISVAHGETEKPILSGLRTENEKSQDSPPGTFMVSLARTWMNARTANAKLRQAFERIRKKIFPSYQPSQSAASPIMATLLAVVLPLVLILASAAVYSRTGKTEQYSIYMEQAQNLSLQAKDEKDPLKQHDFWLQTLNLVKAAETYSVTQESRMLYEQAQFLLDNMDLAARLDFRPALTQFFPEGVVISRIKASSSGVYLLDETSGSVLRIFLNSKGFYEIDDEFKCAPGPYGLETLTDLVDFVILPANVDNYKIMALDAQANLLYCRPGELAVSRKLNGPETGWGRIIKAAYENDTLYIMDAENDAIWMFAGKDPSKPKDASATGIVFSEDPIKYLDEDIPDFGGAIDMMVNQEDLYILHEDGHMTQCRYSAEKAVRLTECNDPSPYTDNRIGRTDKKPWIFADAAFSMAQSTRLPNASIYLLDTMGQSVYQFSFQLNLERVLRPQYNKNFPLPSSAPSGFGITPESDIFLAFNNRLFIAPMQ